MTPEQDALLSTLLNLRTHLAAALPHAEKAATYSADDGSAKECLRQLEVSKEWCDDMVKELMPGLPTAPPNFNEGSFIARMRNRRDWK